jgi:predicted ATPase
MRLIERESYIDSLKEQFSKIAGGEGHCIFVCGESGIGKTSLLKAFTKDLKKDYQVYEGTCDALFTPRPLAPLYDIAWQIRHDLIDSSTDLHDRAGLFSRFFQELKKQDQISIIVFEDIPLGR